MSIYPIHQFAAGLSLKNVLPEAQILGAEDVVFQTVCGKWDECETDDLFVAISEADGDGHDQAQEAIARGAKAIVGERLLPVSAPQFIVKDSRIAYGRICHALAGNPSHQLSTIGVSGTAGKTVTCQLIHSVLRAAELTTGLSSTAELRFGDLSRAQDPQTNAPTISNQLAKMAIGRCSHAVIEASSQVLAQHSLSGIELDMAVLTNLQRHQANWHGSFENYVRANARMLSYLKSTGIAVINADDPHSMELLNEISVPALTYGIHRDAEVTAKLLDRCGNFQTFILSAGVESTIVRTNVIGKQHMYHCLAATAVGLTLGIDLKVIVRGLESAQLPGRLERADFGQEFGLWIDSAHSANQLNGAISAIAPVCEGKLWCVCSVDEAQSETDRNKLGTILERKAERTVITSNFAGVPKSRVDYEPFHQVIDGFEDPSLARLIPNRIRAIEWVLSQAEPGDSVLITGCGSEPIGNVSHEGNSFTDRDACKAFFTARNSDKSASPEIYKISDYQ